MLATHNSNGEFGKILLFILGLASLVVVGGYIVYLLDMLVTKSDKAVEVRVWIAIVLPFVVAGLVLGATGGSYTSIKESLRDLPVMLSIVVGGVCGLVIVAVSSTIRTGPVNRGGSVPELGIAGDGPVWTALILSLIGSLVIYLLIQAAGRTIFLFSIGATIVGGLMLLVNGPPQLNRWGDG